MASEKVKKQITEMIKEAVYIPIDPLVFGGLGALGMHIHAKGKAKQLARKENLKKLLLGLSAGVGTGAGITGGYLAGKKAKNKK